MAEKRMRDHSPIDLRVAANSRDKQIAREARAEFKRRINNLRGAFIPGWEQALRGPIPSRWKVV